jgi:hypothetical protein
MKLANHVENQPIVSNVGEIGEFRIRNSAKAFNILSSGLYANKIRAIIRELSCNAIDSHVAAGKGNTPFDVHLPNQLEPHFSIRDYGTGLNHEQVTNIYTTYFESTKTASNEFIGALGLGSKSPFSYTDNFTVTAVQNGKKGIYTAFINDQGVPSIALMMEEETTDPNGVEVRFAVTDRYDFEKFKTEARSVYTWFKQRPVISGVTGFTIPEIEYETKDIIPGVHSGKQRPSMAVMGNIAYPIHIPDSDKTLDGLRYLLDCGLIMEFDIGELDFQASREGLSYIPQTIQSIKNKLEKLNDALAVVISTEADKITNTWEKSIFLCKKYDASYLWKSAVNKYVTDTKFEFVNMQGGWARKHNFKLDEKVLKERYNILIRGFSKSNSYSAITNKKVQHVHEPVTSTTKLIWEISISNEVRFVINDTKIGAMERAKYHMKSSTFLKDNDLRNVHVFILEPYDKTKPVKLDDFKKLIASPPESYFLNASTLLEKERAAGIAKNVTIMRLEDNGRSSWRDRNEMVWRDAGKANEFASNVTYYYIPLSGYTPLNKCSEVKLLHKYLDESGIHTGKIYGVRKTNIEFIKTQKNWVELDKLILDKLSKMDKSNIMGLVKRSLDINDIIKYNSSKIDENSPFSKLVNTFKDIETVDVKVQLATEWLCKKYDVKTPTNPQTLIDKYTKDVNDVKSRYPLLKYLSYGASVDAVAEYVNLIDQSKGV